MNDILQAVHPEDLLQQANGDAVEAIKLAAIFGYRLAMQDLDEKFTVNLTNKGS